MIHGGWPCPGDLWEPSPSAAAWNLERARQYEAGRRSAAMFAAFASVSIGLTSREHDWYRPKPSVFDETPHLYTVLPPSPSVYAAEVIDIEEGSTACIREMPPRALLWLLGCGPAQRCTIWVDALVCRSPSAGEAWRLVHRGGRAMISSDEARSAGLDAIRRGVPMDPEVASRLVLDAFRARASSWLNRDRTAEARRRLLELYRVRGYVVIEQMPDRAIAHAHAFCPIPPYPERI